MAMALGDAPTMTLIGGFNGSWASMIETVLLFLLHTHTYLLAAMAMAEGLVSTRAA
jgi:hypothetical protein